MPFVCTNSTVNHWFSELKSNQRKALSELDNITAAGLSAINDMTELVKCDQSALTNSEKKELLPRIKSMTSYIKLKYFINCLKQGNGTIVIAPYLLLVIPNVMNLLKMW